MNLIETKRKYIDGELNKSDYIKSMYVEHHYKLFDYREFIGSTDINSIEITEDTVIFDCGEHHIKITGADKDYRIAPIEIMNFSKYEPEETEMMLKLIPCEARVFDIGANVGWYSFLFAANDPNARIYSFEPIPSTFEKLEVNHELNNFKNISLYNFGFSDTEKELTFYYYPEGSGNASSVNVSDRKDITEVKGEVKKIDDCFLEISDRVDFIKCDVEGAELLVFKGGEKIISQQKPIIFSEILRKWSAKFNYHPNDIISFFKQKNYECFVVKGGALKKIVAVDDTTVETNYFFLHKEKHKTLIEVFSIK